MSPTAQVLTKKRKNTASDIDMEMAPPKKTKKEDKAKKSKKQKKDKGKAKESEFKVIKASLTVSVPPAFASTPRAGVEELLDSTVMRYIPALRGVVLAHSNLTFLDKTATIIADSPFLVCKIAFDATVWSPHVAMKLVGKVNLCSPDHISLLVHRTFNASIPRHHIPTDEWEFEYGPAENDPEFGPGNADESGSSDERAPEKSDGEGGGRWVHKITGEQLGGLDGILEFTVIGLTVANEMLSLSGSIQHDPFSPEHVPEVGPLNVAVSEVDSDLSDAKDEGYGHAAAGNEDDEDDEEVDTFLTLGRRAEEAAAVEETRSELEVEDIKKEKKKKRRASEVEGADEEDGSQSKRNKKSKRKKM